MNIAKELSSPDKTLCVALSRESKIIPLHYSYKAISARYNDIIFLTVKRLFDVFGSLLILFLSLPISLLLVVLIKLSSPGPVFYMQIRMGRNNRAFRLYKFRSMYVNSENGTPVCASKNDPRITSVGKWMRKTHLDEIPNLINVLRGEMSLVGPRPERQYFIDKIVAKAPQFNNLLILKPGVTSWGQVKFGYAQNEDEMVIRMFFDLEYLKDNSLKTDLIILCWTLWVVVKG